MSDGPSDPDTSALYHVELYVSDLEATVEFWRWLLERLGYEPFQRWADGRSWMRAGTYLVFVRAPEGYRDEAFHRRTPGLNHLAFHAASREQVDEITADLRQREITILYEDDHPYAGGADHYAVYFEAPERLKVELVAPE